MSFPWTYPWSLCVLLVFNYFLCSFASSGKPVVQVQCTSKTFSITLKSQTDFNGVVYAGDPNRDCRMLGKGTRKLEFSLPVKQCGIVTVPSSEDPKKLVHKVRLYVQMHPQLQQDSDLRMIEECAVPTSDVTVGEGTIFDANQQKVEIVVPGWMEIIRGGKLDGPKIRGPVVLGKTMSIVIKVTIKDNQDALVTRCFASDGTGADPEMLITDNGCPADSSVVPAFEKYPDQSDKNLLTYWTKFPAFKFPDRNRLYLTCQVVICDFACPTPRCSSPKSNFRQVRQDVSPSDNWRDARVAETRDVINSVRVVNSDLEGNDPFALEEASTDKNGKICYPLKDMMTVIGVLAAILLICILLSICFWWNRRQRKRRQVESSYGTQSNSLYNPSTNYYYMDQYPESHQYSATDGAPSQATSNNPQHYRRGHPETAT